MDDQTSGLDLFLTLLSETRHNICHLCSSQRYPIPYMDDHSSEDSLGHGLLSKVSMSDILF